MLHFQRNKASHKKPAMVWAKDAASTDLSEDCEISMKEIKDFKGQ